MNYERIIDVLTEKVTSLKKTISKKNEVINAKSKYIDELCEGMTEKQTEIFHLQDKVEDLETQVSKLNGLIESANKYIVQLSRENDELRSRLSRDMLPVTPHRYTMEDWEQFTEEMDCGFCDLYDEDFIHHGEKRPHRGTKLSEKERHERHREANRKEKESRKLYTIYDSRPDHCDKPFYFDWGLWYAPKYFRTIDGAEKLCSEMNANSTLTTYIVVKV